MATQIPLRAITAFFNKLRKVNKIKVDKKTTIHDLRSFVRNNRKEINESIMKEKRSSGLYKSFLTTKNDTFRQAILDRVQKGQIKVVERKGKSYVITRIPWTPKESEFLKERKGMSVKDAIASYQQFFGKDERTARGIGEKFRRLTK